MVKGPFGKVVILVKMANVNEICLNGICFMKETNKLSL